MRRIKDPDHVELPEKRNIVNRRLFALKLSLDVTSVSSAGNLVVPAPLVQ